MKGSTLLHFAMCYRKIGLTAWVCAAMLTTHVGFAAVNRPFEPIVIKSSMFMPDFEGASCNQIKVYRYHATSTLWTLVSSQIDEKQNNSYFAGENNGLENNLSLSDDVRNNEDDELVFLAADAGDQAPEEAWIGDESTRQYPRFEIILTDTLTGEKSYMYIFRTDVGSDDPGLKDYIAYLPDPIDGILTDVYGYAHNIHGLFSDLSIQPFVGGNGLDIVDRMKVRLKGSGSYSGIPLGTQRLTEDNLIKGSGPRAWAIDGRVRVIRKWNVKFYLNPFTIDIKNEVFFKFYPHFCDYADLKIKTPDGLSVSYARFSFDLDPDANGMQLFTNFNQTGVLTNHTMTDGEPDRTITTPGWNWWMHTGAPGSMLFVGYLPQLGTSQYLYYQDNVTGTNDPDTKFSDTGYDGSWGDTGVKYNGSIAGDIAFSGKLFMLGPNISPDSAASIMNAVASPLKVQVVMNIVVPVELASFTAATLHDQVRLSWSTASESGNLGFAVERKTGRSEVWQRIGFVKGNGTVSSLRMYEFNDEGLAMGDYQYRLKQIDLDGAFHYSPIVSAKVNAPEEFVLLQNYPNPFNPRTTISYRIPKNSTGRVTLSIIDMLGRTVATLVDEPARPGYFRQEWDGLDYTGQMTGSGVYFYLLTDGQHRQLRKMIKVQ